MLTDGDDTCLGEHCIMYKIVYSVCCTSEWNNAWRLQFNKKVLVERMLGMIRYKVWKGQGLWGVVGSEALHWIQDHKRGSSDQGLQREWTTKTSIRDHPEVERLERPDGAHLFPVLGHREPQPPLGSFMPPTVLVRIIWVWGFLGLTP